MLISNVTEDCEGERTSYYQDYQTASELFDLMIRNAHFESSNDSLSAQDLILLYQNMEAGEQVMNDTAGAAVRRPNQYVETVVYNDLDDTDSDFEIYDNAELSDVFEANQERLDFLSDNSLQNLCYKSGNTTMKTNLDFDYTKNFYFHHPFNNIKRQLENFNFLGNAEETDNLYSTSLIDYICSKRLEDNYNFYMENIIRYVQHTIDQLKRISNGDYLTDRAKEKWKEIVRSNVDLENDLASANTKILAKSTSVPGHVVNKAALWENVVQSEIDVRSLSKILEKRIIVEIPKLLRGSYRLFCKQKEDNLVISCQKEKANNFEENENTCLDVVLKIKRSQTGLVIGKMSSVVVLKTTPALPDIRVTELDSELSREETEDTTKSPIACNNRALLDPSELKPTNNFINIDLDRALENDAPVCEAIKIKYGTEDSPEDAEENESSDIGTSNYLQSDKMDSYASLQRSYHSIKKINQTFCSNEEEQGYTIIAPHELQVTMRKLNMEKSTLDESAEDVISQCTSKKRSPVRNRIKSPYENKSFSIEDKKRKRLLEIRARREKRKMALAEKCKVNKHKNVKGSVMPQASNSVTKLSITNRSFYNSIYGNNSDVDKFKSSKNRSNTEMSLMDENHGDCIKSSSDSSYKNSKYSVKSFNLDEPETEMMYMQRTKGKEVQSPHSTTNSVISYDSNENLDSFKQLNILSETINDCLSYDERFQGTPEELCVVTKTSASTTNNPNIDDNDAIKHRSNMESKIKSTKDDCRKSISQLYDVMNGCENKFFSAAVETASSKTDNEIKPSINMHEVDTIIRSNDSGTSVKNNPEEEKIITTFKAPLAQPKVFIKSNENVKSESKKEPTKRLVSPEFKGPLPENPLKAISQLLHQIDNVQKKQKNVPTKSKNETKIKKVEIVTEDHRQNSRLRSYSRRSRFEQHRENGLERKPPQTIIPKDKISRPAPTDPSRILQTQQNIVENIPKKQIADILDEVKEARGEAVRGPSKFSTRLESLAQPKKSYVQAHREEYQTRYVKSSSLAERVHRLASRPPSAELRGHTNNTRGRIRQPAPPAQFIEETARAPRRRPASGRLSPVRSPPAHTSTIPPPVAKKVTPVNHYPKIHSVTQGHTVIPTELRSRLPLVSQDVEIKSFRVVSGVEEPSLMLNSTHHSTISSSARSVLAALAECSETTSDPPHSESDYCINASEDRNITTVVSDIAAVSNCESLDNNPQSTTYLELLETPSSGSKVVLKNFGIDSSSLSPKTSMQRFFLFQSGDSGSALVTSASSLNKLSVKSLHELKTLPVFSNSHLDWIFTQIPMQISTVGYAFTQNSDCCDDLKGKTIKMSTIEKNISPQTCQSSQCYSRITQTLKIDAVAQVQADEVSAELATVAVQSHILTNVFREYQQVNDETQIANMADLNKNVTTPVKKDIDTLNKIETLYENENNKDLLTATSAPTNSIALDHTESLDMLVGILNEIHKITCQNQAVVAGDQISNEHMSIHTNTNNSEESHRCDDNLFNEIRKFEPDNICNNVAQEPRIESRAPNDGSFKCFGQNIMKESVAVETTSAGVDKEVFANISLSNMTSTPKEEVKTIDFDDKSIDTIIDKRSSIISFQQHQSSHSVIFRSPSIKKIIELPQIETVQRAFITRDMVNLKQKYFISIMKRNSKQESHLSHNRCVENVDMDPMIKMKRDILVSVYSMLVLTVFAALSFPELMAIQSQAL